MKKKKDELIVRRRIWFGLWILSLVGISFYGGFVSYGLFFTMTLIPFLSFGYLVLVYFFFKIYQKVESRDMICGTPASYYFLLQNDGFIPFPSVSVKMFSSFSSVEKIPEDTEFELLRADRYVFETKLVCKYRGEYEVGVKEVVVTDFFRLFRIKYRIPSTIRAIVKPRIVRVSKLNSLGEMMSVLQKQSLHAGEQPDVTVRDYVAGDALKKISWKLTAREGKLKVRNRITEEKQGICLFADTRRYSKKMEEYLPLENKMLEIMLALGIFLAENNMEYTAYYSQGKTVEKTISDVKDFNGLYENLSEVIFSEREDVCRFMNELYARDVFRESKVIFGVLHELNKEILEKTIRISETGVLVVLYVVTDEKQEEYVKFSNERRKIITVPIHAQPEGRL